jgi:Copper type II ascorbate-dependent monooxygenase, C-terminal domain
MLSHACSFAFPAALGLCLVTGCSDEITTSSSGSPSGSTGASTSSSGAGGSSSTSSSAGTGGMDPATTTLTATMGPFTIQPGEEAVKCVVLNLGNPATAFVRRFRTKLEQGSHHMIVYTSTEAENPVPFDCQSFGVTGGSAIFIAQQPHSELVFPKDPSGVPVGLELTPNQLLRLEMHYINPTNAPLDVVGTAEMDVLPEASQVIKSGFAFEGQLGIPVIPAFGEADTGIRFQQGIPGTHIFALTTHQHHLGTEMKIWLAADENDTSHLVADGLSWSDPPLVSFDPPLDFPAGPNPGFTYDCHWKNPTASPVTGGLAANDEMCFFWHYYYPAVTP